MTSLEAAALNHAAEWLRYSKSPQARVDAANDRAARAAADRKAGHSPMCGLTRCHPSCARASA